MRLTNIVIHNFRGVLHQPISFQNYSLLVGANNAGKSTVVDAIRAVYEKDGFKFKKDDDFPKKGNADEEAWVELEFLLSDDEYLSLKAEYQLPNKTLKVRKSFLTEDQIKGKNAAGAIRAYTKDGVLADDHFYGAKNVQNGKLGELIYIPAISKVDDHTKLSGPSALRDLLTGIMSNVVEGSDYYSELDKSVSSFADGIRSLETDDQKTLSGFETDLNSLLAPWETTFSLQFKTPSTADIIKSMLAWQLKDQQHDGNQKIEYFGSGFQRHFIFSLIQLGASYLPQKKAKKEKDFSPEFQLMLFEEPEAFLHPPQQEDLARNLIVMGQRDGWQVIVTTHSSNFVSLNSAKIPALVRMRRVEGEAKAYQCSEERWRALQISNQEIFDIEQLKSAASDKELEMESIKYFLWLNSERSSMFFSNHVLLVEGPTETAIIRRLIDEFKIKPPNGVYVCDSMGKYNTHRFMNLLTQLGVDHSVIIDDDGGKPGHKELNELIQKTASARTKKIELLSGDIESFLGVAPAGAPHRKPQHLMLNYERGNIDEDKISEFCQLVESCFT